MRRAHSLGVLVAFSLLSAGCGDSHVGSRAGVDVNRSKAQSMSDAQAISNMRTTRGWWRHQIRTRAAAHPRQRFDNPTTAELHLRLATLATQYHFAVKSLDLWQPLPRQFAPTVVVQANDPQAFASATGAIMRELDPKDATDDDRTGWRYEGFFLEATDGRGVPFVGVYNFWRGVYSRGGGQWARSPDLFPFPRGGRP